MERLRTWLFDHQGQDQYLGNKQITDVTRGKTTYAFGGDAVVLVDDVFLRQLERTPSLAGTIGKTGTTLVNPRGFESGINMFNSGSANAIFDRTAKLLDRAKQIAGNNKVPFDEAINEALDHDIKSRLAAVDKGLADRLLTVDLTKNSDTSSAAIARQLDEGIGISDVELAKELAKVPERYRPYLRELLANQAEIYSSRRIGDAKREFDQQIKKAIERGRPKPSLIDKLVSWLKKDERKVNPTDNLYYFIPEYLVLLRVS